MVSASHVLRIRDQLTVADRAVLELVAAARVLSSTQIRRAVTNPQLPRDEASNGAGARANRRLLVRLQRLGLLRRLPRRIGGPGGGSAAPAYLLTALGTAVIDSATPILRDPSRRLLAHSLTVAEVLVTLRVAEHLGHLVVREAVTEPAAWRTFTNTTGGFARRDILKPDVFVLIEANNFLRGWFVEIDLATERLATITAKAHRYHRYLATGAEQDQLGFFPHVLWVVPTNRRRHQLTNALAAIEGPVGLHQVVLDRDLPRVLSGDQPLPSPRPPPAA